MSRSILELRTNYLKQNHKRKTEYISLKFHHSPYVWHSSGDNVFTPVSYPLTLWSCLSHITSLLPYTREENWIVTSLSIPEDNFWGLRVIQWIFFKGLVGWVTVPSSKFSRHINQKWPLRDIHNIEEFFYICFHGFLPAFFSLGCYQNKQKNKANKQSKAPEYSQWLLHRFRGLFPPCDHLWTYVINSLMRSSEIM